jgi:hypothetical protein
MTRSGTGDDEEEAVQAEGGLPARATLLAGENAAGNSSHDVCSEHTVPVDVHSSATNLTRPRL